MKIFQASLLASVVFSTSLHAEVQAVNIVLTDSVTSYSVPAGKTLIIEHFIWALDSGSTHQSVQITPSNSGGSGAFLLKFSTESPDSWTPPRPIRLAGGGAAAVSILFSSGGADWRDVMICGLLVDDEDLYAAKIDTELQNVRRTGNTLLADVKVASPRPRITTVETSDNLQAFAETPDTTVTPTTEKSVELAAVTASADKKFLRASSKARPLD